MIQNPRRLLQSALVGCALLASGSSAGTLEDARRCLALRQDTMRLACYDAVFEALEAAQPPAASSAPAGEPANIGEPGVGSRVASRPAQAEPREAATARDAGGFTFPRLWRREGDEAEYTAVVVARYPLARKRWILRTDGYELFESFEAQDWVPEVGEQVSIDPAAFGAGFTVRGARGGARMKRLACDGSSRRKETRRKCELLLDR